VAHFDAVFDRSLGLRFINGPAMTIELTDDFVPYYVNGARPIAYADRPEVKQILYDLLAAGIIAQVEPSDWAVPSSSRGNQTASYVCASTILN
jgi:hypothetical protein